MKQVHYLSFVVPARAVPGAVRGFWAHAENVCLLRSKDTNPQFPKVYKLGSCSHCSKICVPNTEVKFWGMDDLKSFKWKDHNFCRVHIQLVFLSLFLEWFEQLLARSSFKFCFKLHCFFLMVVLGTQSHLKIQIWQSYNQQNIWLMIAPSHIHARLCLSALARGDCHPKPSGSAQTRDFV